MENFVEKVVKIIPSSSNYGSIIPNNAQEYLRNIGGKGGQKYSNLIDKLVDTIFKK